MRINHNIAALNTHRQLGNANANQSKSMEKLSSGMRINRAGDDAAGLAISEKMRSQIRGLDQASANAQDGISLIQTAEGALNETHSILQRMSELATQAANGTNTGTDRGEIQKEMNQLTSEINRIGNTTEFNTQKLLNGEKGSAVVTGSGTTITTTKAIAQNVTVTYAKGVDFTGTGTAPTITSASGNNTINFTGTAPGGFDWDKLDKTASNELTLTKSGTDILVNFAGTDTSGETLTIAADKMAIDSSGNYSYNNNGMEFKISKTDVDAMKNGDEFSLELGLGGLAISGVATATIGTKNDWSGMTPSTSGAVAAFGASGIKVSSGAAQLLDGVTGIKITGTGLSGTTGTIQVDLLDSSGASITTETYTFTNAQTDTTFSYDNNGIEFDLAIGKTKAFSTGAVDLATATTATTTGGTTADQSLKLQIGANQNQSMTIEISDMRANSLGITGSGAGFSTSGANVTDGTNNVNAEKSLNVLTHSGASNAITVINKAIETVSAERSKLGASQNRLDHTINNLATSSENLTAAESRIRDVDMAKEMMNQTKESILAQASQAMLAQANQKPQSVLQLLQ